VYVVSVMIGVRIVIHWAYISQSRQ